MNSAPSLAEEFVDPTTKKSLILYFINSLYCGPQIFTTPLLASNALQGIAGYFQWKWNNESSSLFYVILQVDFCGRKPNKLILEYVSTCEGHKNCSMKLNKMY